MTKNVSVPESSFDTSKYMPAHPKARGARGHFRVTFHHYFDPRIAATQNTVDVLKGSTNHA